MRAVHDRMPVILAPDDWAAWLEDEDPAALLRPAPDYLRRVLAGVQGGELAAQQWRGTAGRAAASVGRRRRPEPGLNGGPL